MDLKKNRGSAPTDRIVQFFLDPMRRFLGLGVLAYVTGVVGLGVTLLTGSVETGSGQFTVGLVLMFTSFIILFYLSVTILETHGQNRL